MIATTRTTTFEVQLLGAVDLWRIAADAVDLRITDLVAVDSPRRGWMGHGLSGAGPVAVAVWTRPDTEVVEVELATDVADDTEHQELVTALERRLGDQLVSYTDLAAYAPAPVVSGRSGLGRMRSAAAVALVDRVSFYAATLAYWVAAAMLAVPGGLLPGWVPLTGGGIASAVAMAAGGWLVRQIGRPVADLVNPTVHETVDTWLVYLRYRAIPWLLAVAVVVLGAGWVA